MKTIKLKIHSWVDLITNSSTMIYTYSGGSKPTLIELVNEMLKVFESPYTFDDIYNCEVFADAEAYRRSDLCPYDEEEVGDLDLYICSVIDNILNGTMIKPDWMKEVENECNDDYPPETFLHIKVKNPKFETLARRLDQFLYSTDHEASYG